jgi:release factor glutamine methyltransferase
MIYPMNSLKKTPSGYPQMFHYHDLAIALHPEVYEPAEDSFLLLESIMVHPEDSILEIGTGCGLLALACAYHGADVLCTDINPFAVQLTRQNIERNRTVLKGKIEIRQGDLFSVVKNHERFDLIFFNPPYLPTKKNERTDGWFTIATDGGPTGLRLTKRFLHGLRMYLRPEGAAYFIFSSLSNRSLLEKYLKNERFSATIITSHRYDGEDLDVYRITPTA